ncbi:MAG: SDR family oxidoreductase [Candidatus Marinimicrobia bacterium]|nr:SDR family oxidoreductase [Candidatus Neomarinimicrobiota bacterium]
MTEFVQTKTTALITGASSGIGYELAKLFAQNGHNLVLVARNEKALNQLSEELREKFGISIKVISKDLSVITAAQEIVDELQQEAVIINILVNNAGFDVYGHFYETELNKELQMLQVNLVTLTQLTKLLVGDMVERKSGKILNIASIGSFAPSPLNAVYSATKAYVLSFSEAIAEELHGSGVTVTCLCPGATWTEFQKRAEMGDTRILKHGVMNADTVADIGYRAVMAGKRVVVPGLYNKIQIQFMRLLPKIVIVKLSKFMLQRA